MIETLSPLEAPPASDDRDFRIRRVLGDYLRACETGITPPSAEVLAAHPDLADALAPLLNDHRRLEELAGVLRSVAGVLRGRNGLPGLETDSGLCMATELLLPPADSPSEAGSFASDDFDEDGDEASAQCVGTVFGPYELVEELGRGGMGVVYKARQVGLNRWVALKMIRAGAWASREERRRFRTEAEAVATLDHPHIVPIYEVGRHRGRHYHTMKLLSGGSLSDREVRARLVDDPRRIAAIVAEVADAVDHAHRRGILHRDLKPANILLDEDGRAYVTDFGLAKRIVVEGSDPDESLVSMTAPGVLIGTPGYMAPEQALGDPAVVTVATDVYGLGAVLYSMLTGRPPFTGQGTLEVLEKVRSDVPEPPSRTSRGLHRDLETICLRCLSKSPERRYASAADVADDLRRYLRGEPIAARRTSTLEQGWWWCRRHPALATLMGVTAVALVLVATLSQLDNIKIGKLADAKANEAARATAALAESNRRLAQLHFERSRVAFDQEDVRYGLLELVESWRTARAAGDVPLQHLARVTLAAWADRTPAPRLALVQPTPTNDAALSPDGRTLAIAGTQGTVWLRDATNGRELVPPLEHDGVSVKVLAFRHDGRVLLTGGYASPSRRSSLRTRLWDVATGQPLGPTVEQDGSVWSVAFLKTGDSFAVAYHDGTVRVWSGTTSRVIGESRISVGLGGGLRFWKPFDAAGTRVALTRDGWARVWDLANNEPLGPPIRTELGTALALSPDGRRILVGSNVRTMRAHDVASGRPVGPPIEWDTDPIALAYSPDGRTLMIVGGAIELGKMRSMELRFYDVETGRLLGKPATFRGYPFWVSFSPDGRMALTSGLDQAVRLWDAATGQALGLPIHHRSVAEGHFSHDGRTLLSRGSDGTILIHDVETGVPMGRPLDVPSPIQGFVFRQDGRELLTRDAAGRLRGYGVADGQPTGPTIDVPGGIETMTVSPDGRTILTGGEDGTLRLWDAGEGRLRATMPSRAGRVAHAAFSPDGRVVLTHHGSAPATEPAEARLWDAGTGQPIGDPIGLLRTFDKESQFSPDSRWAAFREEDAVLRVVDLRTGRPVGPPIRPNHEIAWFGFTNGGRTIVLGDEDGSLRSWDTATLAPIGRALPTRVAGGGARLSPDGKAVLTTSSFMDGTLKLIDLETGELRWKLSNLGRTAFVLDFSPDGRMILGTSEKALRLWDAATGQPIGPPIEVPGARKDLFSTLEARIAPDSRKLVVRDKIMGIVRIYEIPELPDDLDRIAAWIAVRTGEELDAHGDPRPLDADEWSARRGEFNRLGGLSSPERSRLLDPILHGVEPTLQARTYKEIGHHRAAEAAFDAAVAARPGLPSVRLERGQFRESVGDRANAVEDFVHAARTAGSALGDDAALTDAVFGNETVRDRLMASKGMDSHRLRLAHAHWLRVQRRWNDLDTVCSEALTLRPDDSEFLELRGLARAALGRFPAADADLALAIENAGERRVESLRARGELNARLERWAEAAADYEVLVRDDRLAFGEEGVCYAALLLLSGQSDRYRAFCERLAERIDRTSLSNRSHFARIGVLAPGAIDDAERLTSAAESLSPTLAAMPWGLHALGAAHLRAGRAERAMEVLRTSLEQRWSGRALNNLMLALAEHDLGREAEARRHLTTAGRWRIEAGWALADLGSTLADLSRFGPNDLAGISLSNWLSVHVLSREAEARILDPAVPADPFAP